MAISSSDGKTAKSSGRVTDRLTSRMRTAPVMFTAMSRSSTIVGSGTTIITTMPMIAAGMPI